MDIIRNNRVRVETWASFTSFKVRYSNQLGISIQTDGEKFWYKNKDDRPYAIFSDGHKRWSGNPNSGIDPL